MEVLCGVSYNLPAKFLHKEFCSPAYLLRKWRHFYSPVKSESAFDHFLPLFYNITHCSGTPNCPCSFSCTFLLMTFRTREFLQQHGTSNNFMFAKTAKEDSAGYHQETQSCYFAKYFFLWWKRFAETSVWILKWKMDCKAKVKSEVIATDGCIS